MTLMQRAVRYEIDFKVVLKKKLNMMCYYTWTFSYPCHIVRLPESKHEVCTEYEPQRYSSSGGHTRPLFGRVFPVGSSDIRDTPLTLSAYR